MTDSQILAVLPQLAGFVAIHAADGSLVWANKFSYGYSAEPMATPQGVEESIFAEDRHIWWNALRRCVYNREIVEYTIRAVCPAKPGWIRIHARMAPILFSPAEEVHHVSIIVHDATFAEPNNPAAAFMLTATEREIVAALLAASPLKSQTIAKRIGQDKTSSGLRLTLTNLSERNILKLQNGGWQITPEFRPVALDLLRS